MKDTPNGDPMVIRPGWPGNVPASAVPRRNLELLMSSQLFWLNMAETELSVLSGQCLDRRIPDKETLIKEVAAWERRRNNNHAGPTGNSPPPTRA